MTKLLYITNGIKGAAGLERVLSIKASYLADHLNYEVHILALNHNNDSIFYDFSQKIFLHDVKVSGNILQYVKQYVTGVKSVVKEIQPDIISVCDDGLKGFFLPMILGKPCPIIYERHVSRVIELGENPSTGKKILVGLKFLLMNQLAKSFDRFVVLTSDNVKEWKLKNCIVISNPLSFYPEKIAALDLKKIIAVGRHDYQKGFDRLLQSWKIIRQQYPDWQLEIYGTIKKEVGLEELAQKLEISDSVSFLEPVKNIDEKYAESSVFAFSSRYEGFGMVLIEAMACGVPCVSFDCPCGPADIIQHGVDGLLVSNNDIDNFTAQLQNLMADEGLRKTMGAKARENVKRYLPENIILQWDNLFKTLVK